jgi:hypothetical protein
VLEVHDIDPSNPASQVAAAIVLFDGLLTNPPGFATYALINAATMQCSVAFTRVTLPVNAMVRSMAPGQIARTRRPGALLDGADCKVSQEPALQFYPQYAPLANETIEVSYRGYGRALARVVDAASIAAHQFGMDDGVRGGVRRIGLPAPRTSADCETAALALLDDPGQGWSGEYRAWSPFLPGGVADIFPGDGLAVNVPSRGAAFTGVVREVDVEVADLAGENSRYTLRFVDAGDPALDFVFDSATAQPVSTLIAADKAAIGTTFLPDLAAAAVTNITSTTVTIDAGFGPGIGEGIEVRRTDAAWGPDNDRNLVGRFTSQNFTVTRYGRVQDFFLRRFDGSSPPKYSRYSAGLHVDYPLWGWSWTGTNQFVRAESWPRALKRMSNWAASGTTEVVRSWTSSLRWTAASPNKQISTRRVVMNFLQKLLQGIAFVPAVVSGIEGLFGSRSGAEKKESAISFVTTALQLSEAVGSREIVDEEKFKEGLSKVIDGTVECLNASSWSRTNKQ